MDILTKLKSVALEQGITVAELEKKAGFSNGLIGKWSASIPKADSLYKVALILNKPVEYFLSEENPVCCKPSSLSKNCIPLSSDELELVENYKNLDNRGKHKLHTIIYDELDRMEQQAAHADAPSSKENAG